MSKNTSGLTARARAKANYSHHDQFGSAGFEPPMATSNGSGPLESSLPQLAPHETKLVELASSGSTRGLSLSEKESQILELYDRIHEQQLEEALLRQGK